MAPPTLVTLPYDIKLQILKELLYVHKPIDIFRSYDVKSKCMHLFTPTPLYVAILRTCRSLYDDAIHVMYGLNIFQFSCGLSYWKQLNDCLLWTAIIGQDNLARVASISLSLDFFENRTENSRPSCDSIKSDLSRATQIRTFADMFTSFSISASKLRNLTLSFIGFSAKHPNSIIHQITLLGGVVSSLRNINSLTVKGPVPLEWMLYLNQKMRVPVRMEGAYALRWGLLDAIDLLHTELSFLIELRKFKPLPKETRFQLSSRTGIATSSHIRDEVIDHPQYYLAGDRNDPATVASATLVAATNTFKTEHKLKSKFCQSPVQIYNIQRQMRIKKMEILRGFRDELKELGMLRIVTE
ncbi:hypothetical protein K505DRAFT_47133 [Melanomma pulvis-pyrius CBS 109.77]|uniref:F-box domain-containing protein n=1 Tax=Melanomma pulvis-pyrius CBS 109.77 TaxID=1314802 RepID=A0A6A6XTG7_9PLEO|nr:hypothetical protein K505DRAFT_47133 [Melanomma pulvis-pyrius CBS 109.77]